MFDLDIVDILVVFIALIVPACTFWTGIYLKRDLKETVPISLLSAIIIGIILQSPMEGHPHVPGSDVIVIAFMFIFTLTVIILTLIFIYIYAKIKKHN